MSQNRALAEHSRMQLRQKDERIGELDRQLQDLQQQLFAANEEKALVERNAAALQQQCRTVMAQIGMDRQNSYTQGYTVGLQTGAAEANARLQQTEEQLTETKRQLQQQTQQVKQQQQQLQEQQQQLEQQRQQLKQQQKLLRQQEQQLQQHATSPQPTQELQAARVQIDAWRLKYERQAGQLEQVQRQVKDLQDQLRDQNAQLQRALEAKTKEHQEHQVATERDYKRKLRELRKEVQALRYEALARETAFEEQSAALAAAQRSKRGLSDDYGNESPLSKRPREPAQISPSISSEQSAPAPIPAPGTTPSPSSITTDNHALLFNRKLEALREAFTLYAVIAESAHATRSKSFTTPEMRRIDCGDGSWFTFSCDVVTRQAPATAIRVARETLFDDCLERLSKRSLNTMAKFVEVAFTRNDVLVATKKRRENATDEGGLVTEMFTLFFESLPDAGIRVKEPITSMLRCTEEAVRLFNPSQGYLFPATIEVDRSFVQVLPETATFQSVQAIPCYRDPKFRAHLDELWKLYDKIGRVYNQAIRQGQPIPELMLHPLLFHFLISNDDYPDFRTLTESAETIAAWLRSFDEEYTWFCNGVLNDDYDNMIASLVHAEIPTELRISAHEFHVLQPFQKGAKRKLWLAEFVKQRIYQPCIGALRAMRQGFQAFPIAQHLSMFTWEEFKRIAIGVQEVSAEQLATVIEFEGSREFRTVFLEAIRQLSDEEVRSFLFFCTAMRHLHEGSVVRVEEDTSVAIGAYPRAYTCFQQLRVPFQPGTSPDIILASLRGAINTNRMQKFEYDEG